MRVILLANLYAREGGKTMTQNERLIAVPASVIAFVAGVLIGFLYNWLVRMPEIYTI